MSCKTVLRVLPLLAMALTATTCRGYPFQFQSDGEVKATTIESTVNEPSESDILFVLDTSGSMGGKIDQVNENVITFVERLSESGNRFRIAVTSTDSQEQPSDNCDNPPNYAFTQGADAVNHGRCGRFLAPKTRSYPEAFLSREKFASASAFTTEFRRYLNRAVLTPGSGNTPDVIDTANAVIGTRGSAWEQPIKGAFLALSEELTGPGKPNAGFFRPDALLLIIIVTDESDCSFDVGADAATPFLQSPSNGIDCYTKASQLVSANDWASRIIAQKGAARLVRVGLISAATLNAGGQLQPEACRILNNEPSAECQCFTNNNGDYCQFTRAGPKPATQICSPADPTCCYGIANDRLFSFANQFRNLKDSICRPSYADTLLKLADLADRQCIALENPPLNNDPTNIEVKIKRNGESVFTLMPATSKDDPQDGWYLDTDGTAEVCLSGTFKRKQGDTVRVFIVDRSTNEGVAGAR